MTSEDLFDSVAAAAGYAAARPPLHPLIVELGLDRVGWADRVVDVALDIGCGAGLSTEPLLGRCDRCLALDPSAAMIDALRQRVPQAVAIVGAAESLPVASSSVDLVTAAGSLDFGDPDRAAAEIARALRPAGVALIYDFTTGSPADGGDDWLDGMVARWPRPPRSAVSAIGPRVFDAVGLALRVVPFILPLPMTRDAYVDYLMTESFVVTAIAGGTARDEIRAELARTVPWPTPTVDVRFDGYVLVARQAERTG